MKTKLHFLITLLHISLVALTAQIKPDFIRFDLPSFVPAEKQFNASLVFKLSTISNDKVEIKFRKLKDIKVKSAKLKISDEFIGLNLNVQKDIILIVLDPQSYSLLANVPYQIILTCYSTEVVKLEKNKFWINENVDEATVDNLFSSKTELESEEINVYESQKIAGKSLQFNENSKLEFQLKEFEPKNLFVEFWLELNGPLENSFSITKTNTKESLIFISQNDLGFVAFPIFENEIVRNDVYLCPGSWNYFGILLSNTNDGIKGEIFVNEKLVFATWFENVFDLKDLKVNFSNKSLQNKFEIDRLKIWNFENNIELAKLNKHFLTYEADSSLILYQTNFESLDEFVNDKSYDRISVKSGNITYTNSDAPIFSKVPQLTVNIGSNYYSIDWSVQEYSVAKEFILERATEEGSFTEIFSTIADVDPSKVYNYTDEIIVDADIVYYRVRQINEDKSKVYSAEVKIGHKEILEFSVGQNYPNPFNPVTSLYVEALITTNFEINVYDLVGNNVKKIYKGVLPEGLHTFEFDGSNLPSGIYFYEVISPHSQIVRKMILAK